MKIGLYFGSFNPVHNGHLIVAQQLLQAASLDKVWFVLSPQNPLKQDQELLDEEKRLLILQKAIVDNPDFECSTIEFTLPRPSYTSVTLGFLRKEYPGHEFSLLMGGDNLNGFEKWKSWEEILEHHEILVYTRGLVEEKWRTKAGVKIFDLPYLHISATFIREQAAKQQSLKYLVPEALCEEISKYYKRT